MLPGPRVRYCAPSPWDNGSSFLIPRYAVPLAGLAGDGFLILRVFDRFRDIEAYASQLQHMSPTLSSKSKRPSKLESDLPTHVRASQTCRTAHNFSRVRQAAVITACVGVALLFGGFSCGYSVHRSQDVTRNPAYTIKAKSAAVASENVLCSRIGVDVMKDGGNAVDAAVATTLCIGVVNMFS